MIYLLDSSQKIVLINLNNQFCHYVAHTSTANIYAKTEPLIVPCPERWSKSVKLISTA